MRALLLMALLLIPAMAKSQPLPERVTGSRVGTLKGDQEIVRGPVEATLLVPAGDEETTDPREGIPFHAQCAVYTPDLVGDNSSIVRRASPTDELVRRFSVHIQDRSMLPAARRAARFLAVLWGMADRRFGRLCARLRQETVDVWMTRHGDAGGELERNNLYIYNLVSDDRSGIEWARELAHEYGHYLLPAPSGYTEPESWANGVLGERLFLNWLWRGLTDDQILPDEVPYVRAADLADYCAKQVTPLIERMSQLGPEPDRLERSDRIGMNAFTAIILYADTTYGSRTVMEMLDCLPRNAARQVRGVDFLTALTTWAGQASTLSIHLATGVPSRVYLPSGELKLQPPQSTTLTLDGKPAGRTRVTGGWHELQLRGGKGSAVVNVERAGA